MRRFYLQREVDETGVSGTGRVAEGVMFSCGRVSMTWNSQWGAVNVYDNMQVVEHLHGHGGNTRVVWIDGDEATVPVSKPQMTDPKTGKVTMGKHLTERERSVLRLLAEGVSTRDVGSQLGISPKTVETHRVRIYHKTNCRNAVELTRYAVRTGMIGA